MGENRGRTGLPADGSGRWLTRPVLGWAMYDVASSTYVALVPALFPVFFTGVVLAGDPNSDAAWGLLISLALLAAGLAAPLLGAVVDGRGRWAGPLAALTLLCCAATFALSLTDTSEPFVVALLFLLAQSAYTLCAAVIDSLVTRVARPEALGRVSSFGWGLGFLGGVGALLVALAVVRPDDGPAVLSRVFGISAWLYLGLGLVAAPGLRLVPHGPVNGGAPRLALAARKQVMATLRSWRSHRSAFRLLIGFTLFNIAGIALVSFAPIFMVGTLGLSIRGLCWYVLLYHVVAAPATYLFGHLTDRVGPRRTVVILGTLWVIVISGVALASGPAGPALAAGLPALVWGGTQAVARALLASRIPEEQAGEFFGFQAVLGRVSTSVGPLAVGIISSLTGNLRLGLGALVVFVLAGGFFLSRALARDGNGWGEGEGAKG